MDVFFLIGTVSFTLTGYLLGVRKRFDWLGVAILALLTAVGGGVLRDVLIQRTPRILYQNDTLWVIAATLALAWALRLQHRRAPQLERLFILADSIGLVAFSIGGAQIGGALGLSAFGVAMLGFISAVGGGMIRDMLVNDIPFILHRDFYGAVSILVALGWHALNQHGWQRPETEYALFALGLALRLWAHRQELRLPAPDTGRR